MTVSLQDEKIKVEALMPLEDSIIQLHQKSVKEAYKKVRKDRENAKTKEDAQNLVPRLIFVKTWVSQKY